MVRFDTTLGSGSVGQQALGHTPRYSDYAVVFANFNAELDNLPLRTPSSVIGKSEEHRAFGKAASTGYVLYMFGMSNATITGSGWDQSKGVDHGPREFIRAQAGEPI